MPKQLAKGGKPAQAKVSQAAIWAAKEAEKKEIAEREAVKAEYLAKKAVEEAWMEEKRKAEFFKKAEEAEKRKAHLAEALAAAVTAKVSAEDLDTDFVGVSDKRLNVMRETEEGCAAAVLLEKTLAKQASNINAKAKKDAEALERANAVLRKMRLPLLTHL